MGPGTEGRGESSFKGLGGMGPVYLTRVQCGGARVGPLICNRKRKKVSRLQRRSVGSTPWDPFSCLTLASRALCDVAVTEPFGAKNISIRN